MRKLLLSTASALALALALPVMAQDSGSSGTQSSQAGQQGQTGGSSTTQPMPQDGSTSSADAEQQPGGASSTGTAQSGGEQPATGTAQTEQQPATGSDMATTSDDSDAGADAMGGPMRGYTAEAESFQGTIAGGYAAEDLIGKSVVGPDGEDIATVQDLLIGSDDSVQHVLVDVGGFLGLGGKTVALNIDELQPAEGSGEELVTHMTEEEIKALPALEQQDGQWVIAEQSAQ